MSTLQPGATRLSDHTGKRVLYTFGIIPGHQKLKKRRKKVKFLALEMQSRSYFMGS